MPKENIYCDEPMSKHTSFKVGGPADYFVTVNTEEQLKYVSELCKEQHENYYVIGNGSNVLVRDGGIRGIVLKPMFCELSLEKNNSIKCGSGVTLNAASKFACSHGLTKLEFACGIPGTLGGAIRMNAGAYGSEMKNIVKKVTYMDNNRDIKQISTDELEFSYRKSFFSNKNYVIISTIMELEFGDPVKIDERMKEIMTARIEKQPLEFPSAGSTFKRGKDFYASQMIDQAGLKGYSIGGAQVSDKHAGFIINKGNATAKDILDLIGYVTEQVEKKFNKKLEPEVEIIGEN